MAHTSLCDTTYERVWMGLALEDSGINPEPHKIGWMDSQHCWVLDTNAKSHKQQISVYNADTGEVVLCEHAGSMGTDFSVVDNKIAIASSSTLTFMEVSPTEVKIRRVSDPTCEIVQNLVACSLTSDCKKAVVYCNLNFMNIVDLEKEEFKLEFDEDNLRPLGNEFECEGISTVKWSPDGKYIACGYHGCGRDDDIPSAIVLLDPETCTEVKRISHEVMEFFSRERMFWSPNSDRIYAQTRRQTIVVDVESDEVTLLKGKVEEGNLEALSPDGKYIAIVPAEHGGLTPDEVIGVAIYDTTDFNLVRFFKADAVGGVVFSRDSKRIMFEWLKSWEQPFDFRYCVVTL
eukprot:GFYU01004092.1.p1 GENE.GFYU01004092.1~~GFYU01004092.1.p1  ORF type:complete len:346 (+),score=87.17 GFYU01004092.1:108-1145(+)